MARIKINDLPTNKKISKKEMSQVMGGKYIGETEKNVSGLLQLELQDKMQELSQDIQIISNIMKTYNDGEKAIINNIR